MKNSIPKDKINYIEIKSDGNCFYRSISTFLYGNDKLL